MMDPDEIEKWCHERGLSEDAKAEVVKILGSLPARKISQTKVSVTSRYPSAKSGIIIQAESHRVEAAFIYEYEYDHDVITYLDQPPSLYLEYRIGGRTQRVAKTADFFCVRREWAEWVECKTEKELTRLSRDYPNRYYKDEEGWHFAPAEDYAKRLGLRFVVRSDREINWVCHGNIRFLEDYYRQRLDISEDRCKSVKTWVSQHDGSTLLDLINAKKADTDSIYALIARQEIFVDLMHESLRERESVHVFSSRQKAEAFKLNQAGFSSQPPPPTTCVAVQPGAWINWDGVPWRIVNSGQKLTLIHDEQIETLPFDQFTVLTKRGNITSSQQNVEPKEQAQILNIIRCANDREIEQANYRLKILQSEQAGAPFEKTVTQRTLRRWQKKYELGEKKYGNGYAELVTQHHKKGNRVRRISEPELDLIAEAASKHYENVKGVTKTEAYEMYVKDVSNQSFKPVSRQTWCKELNRRSKFKQVLAREGWRSAHDHEDPVYWYLDQKVPRHGDRVFEIVHLDHTLLDIELIDDEGKNLGRPWLTLAIDAFSRRILGHFLWFDAPSRVACMMVMRDIVRRYSRSPYELVVDGGPEFQSTYFEMLCNSLIIIKKTRPGAKGEYGNVIERLFGITNEMFIHNLQGNTKATKKVRKLTKAVDPKRHAIWNIEKLNEKLEEFLYEIYDEKVHPALGVSPRQCFKETLYLTGNRPQRMWRYDENFLLLTMMTFNRSTGKIVPHKGIKVSNVYYSCPEMQESRFHKKRVEFRIDPFNRGIILVRLDEWMVCESEFAHLFRGRTWAEIDLIVKQEMAKREKAAKDLPTTAAKIAGLIDDSEKNLTKEVDMRRRQDKAVKKMLGLIPKEKSVAANKSTEKKSTEKQKTQPPEQRETYGRL